MARKKSKSRRRRLIIIGTVCVIAFIFFCINVCTYTYKIVTLTQKQNELAKQLNDLKIQKEELEKEIARLQTPEGLADYARREYLYTRQGEYVIKINDNKDEIEEMEEELNGLSTYRNFIIITSIGVFTIVIIFFRKRK